MQPKIWGPIMWNIFHTLSYSYQEFEKNNYIRFFKSVPYILPCIVCTDHFRETLNKRPIELHLKSREKLIKYLNDIHNIVNKRLYKKIISLSQAYHIYHNSNGELLIDHTKMISFLNIVKKYLSGGLSAVIKFHGTNVLTNFCQICPCETCKISLITLLNNNTNKVKHKIRIFLQEMINIINRCHVKKIKVEINTKKIENKDRIKFDNLIIPNKILTSNIIKKSNQKSNKKSSQKSDKKIENKIESKKILNTFLVHQKIYKIFLDNKLKIISKQIGSTPGVKKIFSVEPLKKYKIHCEIEKPDNLNVFVWIKDLKTNILKKYNSLDNIEYENKNSKRIEIGISLHDPKYNDIFYVKDFDIKKI